MLQVHAAPDVCPPPLLLVMWKVKIDARPAQPRRPLLDNQVDRVYHFLTFLLKGELRLGPWALRI